jgi:DNA-binding beta-propeller fold protein YncE
VDTIQVSAPAIAVVKVPGGRSDFLANAVLSPDGSVAYSTVAKGGDTVVRALDAGTGRERAEQTVSGSYSLPTPDANQVPAGLSGNGRWVVLESHGPPPGLGAPPRSRFVVLGTSLTGTAARVELNGSYRFDAIDDAGRSLYLLEYLPGSRSSYRVRRYDLKSGVLDRTVIADKSELGQPMEGVRVAGLYSPDGSWHFGLYARTTGVAFVHALPISSALPFAFCVDLPAKTSDVVSQMAWAVATTSDGGRLYAANELLGELLELNVTTGGQFEPPRVMRRATLPQPTAMRLPWVTDAQAKEPSARRLALSPDARNLYLASARGIYVIDTAMLSVRARWQASSSYLSMGVTPDGGHLFGATADGRLDEVDTRTGGLVGQVQLPTTIVGLETVRAT